MIYKLRMSGVQYAQIWERLSNIGPEAAVIVVCGTPRAAIRMSFLSESFASRQPMAVRARSMPGMMKGPSLNSADLARPPIPRRGLDRCSSWHE